MSVLSDAQIIALWVRAGGPLSTAPMALAKALAESSGDTTVTSPNPGGGTNVGLWQLDTEGVGAGHTVAELQNPLTNAQLTVKGSRGGKDWAQWPDQWQQFISRAEAAVKRYPGGVSAEITKQTGGGGGLFSWPGQIVGAFTSAGTAVDWLLQPSHWIRIIAFFLGVGAVLSGLVLLAFVG